MLEENLENLEFLVEFIKDFLEEFSIDIREYSLEAFSESQWKLLEVEIIKHFMEQIVKKFF